MAAIGNSCFWLADFFKTSPPKPLGQMNCNLVGSIYGMSSIKIAHFVPIRDWLISKKSSPLKPLGQMNRNLVGSILGLLILFQSVDKHGRHRQFLFLIGWFFFKSSPLKPLSKWTETWKVLYKDCSFSSDSLTNMAAIGNSCFWLANLNKSSPLKPLGQINRNFVGSIYGRSSINSANFVPIR